MQNYRSIVFRSVSQSVIPDCLAIADQALGAGYLTPASFLHPDVHALYGARDRFVVGFAIARVFECQQFALAYPKAWAYLGAYLRLHGGNIGVLSDIAIREADQRIGLGSLFVHCLLAQLDAKKVPFTIMFGWEAHDGVHIHRISQVFGFHALAKIPDYWFEESLSNGYLCPTCGSPPCHCSAMLYIRFNPNKDS